MASSLIHYYAFAFVGKVRLKLGRLKGTPHASHSASRKSSTASDRSAAAARNSSRSASHGSRSRNTSRDGRRKNSVSVTPISSSYVSFGLLFDRVVGCAGPFTEFLIPLYFSIPTPHRFFGSEFVLEWGSSRDAFSSDGRQCQVA